MPNKTQANDTTIAFRFRMDDGTLIQIWADHNNKYKGMDLSDEQQHKAFDEFLNKLFHDTVNEQEYDMALCTDADIRNLSVHGKLKTKAANKAIYKYMAERSLKRCEKLLPKLEAYSDNVELPIGHEQKNYYSDSKKSIRDLAGLFQ